MNSKHHADDNEVAVAVLHSAEPTTVASVAKGKEQQIMLDICIGGAKIHDGTGNPWSIGVTLKNQIERAIH